MKINSLIVILIALSFFACNKDEEEKKETTSSISGKVALYDEGQASVDNSSMTVTVEGASPVLSAQTDTEGDFTIENVPFGTYNLLFEKTGYGTYKYYDISLSELEGAQAITETLNLGKISNTMFVNKFSARVVDQSLVINGATDPEGTIENPRFIRVFYSTDENVSNTNYEYYSNAYSITSSSFGLTISNQEFIDAGFESGSTVFLKTYGDSYWNNSYENPTSGEMVFPNLSTDSPETVSFVIP